MHAWVGSVHYYPVKGMKEGTPSNSIQVDTQVGVMGDRRYAVRRVAGDTSAWAPKREFYVGMNTPKMVSLEPPQDPKSPEFDSVLAEQLGVDRSAVQLQHAGEDYALCDTKGAFISILNLKSVEALARFMGVNYVDPFRFRMNIWLAGLDPFEELAWVDGYPGTRMIRIGDIPMRVDDACERCLAIDADPHTGKRELGVRAALTQMVLDRGYSSPHRHVSCVMGILAEPLANGIIRTSDSVTLL